jgi:hypothetical protein
MPAPRIQPDSERKETRQENRTVGQHVHALEDLEGTLGAVGQDLVQIMAALRGPPSESLDPLEELLRVTNRLKATEQAVQEMIILQHLHEGTLSLTKRTVDLLEILVEVVNRQAPAMRAENKPICLETVQSTIVHVDPRLIRSVVQTMVSCASRHCKRHKPVLLYCKVQGSWVVLSVASQGCTEMGRECPCQAVLHGWLESRFIFCNMVARANGGHAAIGTVGGQGLDLSLHLPLHQTPVEDGDTDEQPTVPPLSRGPSPPEPRTGGPVEA